MTRLPAPGAVIALVITALSLGCGAAPTITIEPDAPTAAPTSSDAPLGAGTYCFAADVTVNGEAMKEVVRMTVDSMGAVEGMVSVAEVSGPEDTGLNTFEGVLEGKTLTVNRWDIFNRGDDPWEWEASRDRLNNGMNVFQSVSCASVADRFPGDAAVTTAPSPSAPAANPPAPTSAAPARTLAGSSTASAPPTPSNVPASEVIRWQASDLVGGPTASDVLPFEITDFKTFPVQFARGSDRATFNTSITEIEAHGYELRARAGQLMEIDMSAEDDTAFFSVFAPNGVVMVRDALGSVATQLPMDGVYSIAVYTYASNDRYTLGVRIR